MRFSIMETYDLSTAQNKMGMMAIRTPDMTAIALRYPGLLRQFKYIRPVHVDVSLACASALPADPLQIGTTAGSVAPQDLFNPILYKVVTNDSWEGLINRIYASTGITTSLGGSVKGLSDIFTSASSNQSKNAYYALMTDPSFKKAHPQAGLSVRHVRPLVWTMLNTAAMPLEIADATAPTPNDGNVLAVTPGGTTAAQASGAYYIRGHPKPYPRVPTVTIVTETTVDGNVVSTPSWGSLQKVYCLAIVTPPSALTLLYYRMVVKWTFEVTELRSDSEILLMGGIQRIGTFSHYEAQSPQPTNSSKDGGMVESAGVDVELVTEA